MGPHGLYCIRGSSLNKTSKSVILDNMALHIDKEKTKKNIALILDKLKTEADPHLLNEYRIIFKKEISFFRRSWAAGYLLMLFEQEGSGTSLMQRRLSGPINARRESRTESRHYPFTEDESKRLFFSIGRNHRVSPRKILGLIMARAGISKDDVGDIRILDNYSFVQVRENAAEKIIEVLNGQKFRGRPLSVNYAINRREEESQEAGDSSFLEQGKNQGDEENI